MAINTTYFPNPQDIYWTTTPHASDSVNKNWFVRFNLPALPGATYFTAKTNPYLYTRCVAGPKRDYVTNPQNFTDNGDGTLTDNATGFTWQKCISGQTWSGTNCTGSQSTNTWTTAHTNCTNLTLAGKTWRLPNINELKSIMDITKADPFLDTSIFPSLDLTGGQGLWSSTTSVADITKALLLVAGDGRLAANNKPPSPANYYFRCVTD